MNMRLPAPFQARVGPGRAGLYPCLIPWAITGAQLQDGAGLLALRSGCCLVVCLYVLKSTTVLASGWGLQRLLRHQ